MSDFRKEEIDRLFKYILETLDGGRLYGEYIDIENIKELVVGAWVVGGSTQVDIYKAAKKLEWV